MGVEVNLEKGIVGLSLQDNIIQESADELRETVTTLLDQGNKFFALDFSGVYLMDSYGMGVLIRILQRITKANGALVLHSLPVNIKRLLDLTRLNLVMEISDSREEAQQRLLDISRKR